MSSDSPRITFGMIVLNGEPFTRYNLRALYPFAHEIIVVEGAAPAAATIATPDGHSLDNTLQILRDFKRDEDPEDKVIVVTAEDEGYANGFWPGEKDEQSRAYAKRATGNYLWQVDVDEFYLPQDMQAVINLLGDNLSGDNPITAISFKQIQFWGGFDYFVDSWYLRLGGEQFHRLFRWEPDYAYTTHRPPTVFTDSGVDTRNIHWLDAKEMTRRGIYLYHYSLVLPSQVMDKSEYYGNVTWIKRTKSQEWAQEAYVELKRPYQMHNVYDYPGWIERFHGEHAPQAKYLRSDLESGKLDVELRQTADIEALLNSPSYQLGIAALKVLSPWGRYLRPQRWIHQWKILTQDPSKYIRSLVKKSGSNG